MECPCCHQTMEPGYLQTGPRCAWTQRIHKISLLPGPGELMLENHAVSGSHFNAYICKLCKKIVVDYSDKDVQEG